MRGDLIPVLENVGSTTTGYSAFSVAAEPSILAYSSTYPAAGELVWLSRDGQQIGEPVAPIADYIDFSLSPDGRRLAFSRVDPVANTPDIWLLDFARSTTTRLTSDPMTDATPMWSRDSQNIVFRSNRIGVGSVFVKPVDGAREERLLWTPPRVDRGNLIPTAMSSDGGLIVFADMTVRTSFDLWVVSMKPQPVERTIVRTAFNEVHARLSPDDRWLAFVSDESGTQQVYVQAFPEGEQRWQISSAGGTEPRWRGDGRELYFIGADRRLMAVDITPGAQFKVGLPRSLFQTRVPILGNPYRGHYTAAAGGQRFLVNMTPANVADPAIHVVLDWRALLNR